MLQEESQIYVRIRRTRRSKYLQERVGGGSFEKLADVDVDALQQDIPCQSDGEISWEVLLEGVPAFGYVRRIAI